MNKLLNKEPVKRVEESLKKFDPNLKILVLDLPLGLIFFKIKPWISLLDAKNLPLHFFNNSKL